MNLLDNYILARWQYSIGAPEMSDMEYNELHRKMQKQYPDNEYVNRVWSEDPCPIELLKRIGREDLYRDISVVFGSESMESLRSDEEVRNVFHNLQEQTRVSYKVDGWNNQVNYYNGKIISCNTRGRATNSKESNVIMSVVPQTIPMLGRVKVIGEASIPNNMWELFKMNYGGNDQRASMSTVVAKHMVDFTSFKAFNIVSPDNELPRDKYQLLSSWGFKTPRFLMVSNYTQLLSAIQMLSKMDSSCDVLTDGLVVENSSTQLAIRVGKWQESSTHSYVLGYNEEYTPYGISMTLAIRPIKIGGKNISVLNITNVNQIIKNNLRIGYPVAFSLRSSANPVINATQTAELQDEYLGRYEEYCQHIDDEQRRVS